MAELYRIRTPFIGGMVEDNPLTSGATTLTSAGLAALGTLATDEYCPIVLDPDGVDGAPEIAYLTAHTTGTTTGTIARGKEGTTARAHERDTPWVLAATQRDFDGRSGGMGLIGLTYYQPGSDSATYSTTSTSFVDVDATNLKVTFTAPPSGTVLVGLTGSCYISANLVYQWNLRDAGGDIANSGRYANNNATIVPATHKVKMTGLTPGTSYTYKWGWKVAAGTGQLFGGPNYGAFVMEVHAVNC